MSHFAVFAKIFVGSYFGKGIVNPSILLYQYDLAYVFGKIFSKYS